LNSSRKSDSSKRSGQKTSGKKSATSKSYTSNASSSSKKDSRPPFEKKEEKPFKKSSSGKYARNSATSDTKSSKSTFNPKWDTRTPSEKNDDLGSKTEQKKYGKSTGTAGARPNKTGYNPMKDTKLAYEKKTEEAPKNPKKLNYAAFKNQPKYFVKKNPKKQKVVHDDDSISLNKFISNSGFCSRREADTYIEDGRVEINEEVASRGNRVYKDDIVTVDGEQLNKADKLVYIAFNKPNGITSTTDLNDPDNVINYMGYPKRIFPIGRLDKDSEGLLLLTNDGDIVNKVLKAGNEHEKEYIVQVNQEIQHDFIYGMKNGIPMLGTRTLPCKVFQEGKNVFRIILVQGLNRQIRRMCEHYGYKVLKLKRTRIMNIKLSSLALGSYRLLTPDEIAEMNEIIYPNPEQE
jgi:23S rRNA pseudouridine2604 synthase